MARILCDDRVEALEAPGDEVTLLGKAGRWTKVLWGELTGWVFGGLIKD